MQKTLLDDGFILSSKNNKKLNINHAIIVENKTDIFEEVEKELKNRNIKNEIKEISDRLSDIEVLFLNFQKELVKVNKKIEKIKKKKGEEYI